MSAKALSYSEESFKHRTIVLLEPGSSRTPISPARYGSSRARTSSSTRLGHRLRITQHTCDGQDAETVAQASENTKALQSEGFQVTVSDMRSSRLGACGGF